MLINDALKTQAVEDEWLLYNDSLDKRVRSFTHFYLFYLFPPGVHMCSCGSAPTLICLCLCVVGNDTRVVLGSKV